ncbi:MAG: T9SS type A sorting domain-containing protein [Bacteroidia bacterium]|nr:T9SS type A sorting domain-containing protein [Bacteroidia bacterium]
MKKQFLLFAMLLAVQAGLSAQKNVYLNTPRGFSERQSLPEVSAQKIDAPSEQVIAEMIKESGKDGSFYKIARLMPVAYDMNNAGKWTLYPDGSRLWRFKIKAEGAQGLSFYFDRFYIPPGAVLFSYNLKTGFVEGPHYANENTETEAYASAIVPGDEIMLEYYQPASVEGEPLIEIGDIGYFFRGLNFLEKNAGDFGASDACQVNVNCSEGSNWQDEKRAAVKIILVEGNSAGLCSGAMVNNTAQDCKNYLLTAQHCGAGASASNLGQWIFYFNFEAPSCPDPSSANNLDDQTKTGCVRRAASGSSSVVSQSDFQLLELNGSIPAAYNVYYAGWNRGATGSSSGVGIHHPSGDIKKISTYTSTLTNGTWTNGTANAHWRVTWVATANGHGVTEGGSSGSPIFDNNGRIVGDLSGGSSFCSTPNQPDLYGKFAYSWESAGAANSQRLRPWLDPAGSNPTTLDGKNACTGTPPVTGSCDTAGNFTSSSTASQIQLTNGDGFLAGNNNYGDKAKAELFTDTWPNGYQLKGAFLAFYNASGSGTCMFKVWSANGAGGAPGTELRSITVNVSSLPTNGNFVFWDLSANPVTVNGNFYVGVVLPTGGTTVALFTSAAGEVPGTTGWEMYNDNSWHSYVESYGNNYAHTIFSVVCPPGTSVESAELNEELVQLFPNPAANELFIEAGKSGFSVDVIDMAGRTVLTTPAKMNESLLRLDVSGLKNGVYNVRIHYRNINKNVARKFVIAR